MSKNMFAQLKKNRASQFEKLSQAADEISKSGGGDNDERYWRPTVDKIGNGSAIIRFLPAVAEEDVPFIRFWDHGFQGPGGWYIEKSLTSLGKDDPASEYNSKLWNSTTDDKSPERAQARNQKRRLHYVSNIYVVSDPAAPDNEGKSFLYEYGKKIFDKINDAMHPQFEDETPVNPFDLWEGANFRLRMQKLDGYRNYDKSTFDKPSPLLDDDSDLEAVWKAEHPLQPIVDPKEFKSYDELSTRLNRVLALTSDSAPQEQSAEQKEKAPWTPPEDKADDNVPADTEDGDETKTDDSLAFFAKLAEED